MGSSDVWFYIIIPCILVIIGILIYFYIKHRQKKEIQIIEEIIKKEQNQDAALQITQKIQAVEKPTTGFQNKITSNAKNAKQVQKKTKSALNQAKKQENVKESFSALRNLNSISKPSQSNALGEISKNAKKGTIKEKSENAVESLSRLASITKTKRNAVEELKARNKK